MNGKVTICLATGRSFLHGLLPLFYQLYRMYILYQVYQVYVNPVGVRFIYLYRMYMFLNRVLNVLSACPKYFNGSLVQFS
jgi:hypothetical protein